ncbi:MAG: hypothetical protein Q8O36_08820 [Candidatus Omnitrophota bacterium]|nr:hypothetical protein [Candidatus Omnitrophota bacterium]MDP3787150.1 hypothetical protein [Candidatus Omnitrophota bacterium]
MTIKIRTSRKGRKCKHPHCKQILSIYNHEVFCHVHHGQLPQELRSKE